ncbi:uncharacterized protein LOC124166809 isoform X2 [Ischnura elegans]|uniref:uncharacterized protein LOC124166809 isoform X2 n=1 Tax=Ischnura elegans TaxID=197161 RepID=UPI001ED871E5|nr:uncharacterized protein LOC124166809 isoform X2 [Ischnura elegans]
MGKHQAETLQGTKPVDAVSRKRTRAEALKDSVSNGKIDGKTEEDEFRDGLDWVPRCFCTVSDGANSMVLMEDLKDAGYSMVDRMVGLDLDQSLLVMRSLGKLHAFSYCLQQKDPVTFQSIVKLTPETWMVPDGKGHRESVYQKCALAAAAAIRERYPSAADALTDRLREGLFKLMTKSVTARDRYSVINHGDVWINNLLFRKRSKGGSWEVKFVDYQMVRYCTPAADLSYFLLTSVERTIREKCFDELLKEYHSTLVRWLDHFGVPTLRSTLPYAELEDQMKKYSFFGIGMALTFLPLYYIGNQDAPDVERVDDSSFGFLQKVHALGLENKEARENLSSVIKLCCDREYI